MKALVQLMTLTAVDYLITLETGGVKCEHRMTQQNPE